MADSDAVRSRRKRRHAAGDHGMCGPACDRRPPPGRQLAAVAGSAAEACTDPAAALAALAGRLVAAHEADPGDAALARECRATLLALAGLEDGAGDGDPLAGLRALADPVS
jgi:hypothetical protein